MDDRKRVLIYFSVFIMGLISGMFLMNIFSDCPAVDVRVIRSDEHELIEKTNANPYDIFGNTPDKVVNDYFTAMMAGDYEKAYQLHPQGELYLKPTLEEYIQMWESIIIYDVMVLDYTITNEDKAGVRVYYVTDPGYGENMIMIRRTYWACTKEDGVWKVEWMAEQG